MIDPATIDWRVYAIIDASGDDPIGLTRACVNAGVGIVQLRDKRGDVRAMVELARAMRAICDASWVPLVINDRLDVALVVGAAGLHLGPNDLRVEDARRAAPNLLLGASVGTPEAAIAAVAAGADYLGSGAVYDARGSKPDAHHNRGLDALRAVAESVEVPVVGIGGIRTENAREVRATGAAGVAVIRELLAADLAEVVRGLRGEAS